MDMLTLILSCKLQHWPVEGPSPTVECVFVITLFYSELSQ